MPPADAPTLSDLMAVIARHWGFDSLRPLQEQAMTATLAGRDTLVVLPTGGGKSLCYQAPAVARGGTTVVVSPLIALMKDQVDALRACGVAAAQLDSSLDGVARLAVESELKRGRINLLFVSPERLVGSDLYRTLKEIGVRTFAIDEAHCISHWGHDFRPEYRQMALLREHFPDATIHGYTATATEQVRRDIIAQLALRDPVVLVGYFDRANLTYRVTPRHDALKQTLEVIERHPGEAGIVYCMRRRDVEALASKLRERKVNARPYHAGLSPMERQLTQEEFRAEKCDVVVATIAFGMGIDRSNVRFVLHTAMPKSLEHYQQETGRAGRDGLEAECVLLYSGGDVMSMKAMITKSAAEAGETAHLPAVLKHLEDMDRYARGAVCRHKALVSYFGQEYQQANCGACDLCLGDSEEVPQATVVAQKILSCVARVKEGYGIGHVLSILRGKNVETVRKRGHEKLSTFGLLEDHSDSDVRDWIYQLLGQEVLCQTSDEYPKLQLNEASWEVMKGQRQVRLVQLARKKGERPRKSSADVVSWEGVDQGLFAALRELRRELAAKRQVPPYVIFSDTTLRELARARPSSPEAMRQVYGVGEAKLRDLGEAFLKVIAEHCRRAGLGQDVRRGPAPTRAEPSVPTPKQLEMFELFRQELSVAEVVRRSGMSRGTVAEHLAAYIRHERPGSILRWVDEATYHRVAEAARQVGTDRLKPIYLALGERVDYETIRVVVTHVVVTTG